MTESSKTLWFARAGLFISAVTFALVAFSPKQTACPAATLSMEQTPATYVFTDPAVAARRAQSARDTEQSLKKSCAKYPKGYDCLHLKPRLMPKTNTEWGIPQSGQTIRG